MYLNQSKLHAAIKHANLSVPQLAKASGLSIKNAYNLVDRTESCNPTIKTLNALANALGCKVSQLVSE